MVHVKYESSHVISEYLRTMPGALTLVCIKADIDCVSCNTVENIVNHYADLSHKIRVKTFRLPNPQILSDYRINKSPAVIFEGPAGDRIRFFGLPCGPHFTSFLGTFRDVWSQQLDTHSPLSKLSFQLKRPLHLEVYVPMTSLFMPSAVPAMLKMVFDSPWITADVIESAQFQDEAKIRHALSSPVLVINDERTINAQLSEFDFSETVIKSIAGIE